MGWGKVYSTLGMGVGFGEGIGVAHCVGKLFFFSTIILLSLVFTFSSKVVGEGGLYLTFVGAAARPQASSDQPRMRL